MADAETTKKYYWLKLKRDFFKRHDIRIVEEMPNGKDYVLFYLKMLVESIDHDGELRFSETIPYNEQMLSVITNTNIDIVRHAMKLFIELKMIDVFDDATIYMSEVQKLIGNETDGAERVRKHRDRISENKRLLQCNADVTKCNTEKETETETDQEKKTDNAEAFGAFWTAYPNKKAKPAALKAFFKLKPDTALLAEMLKAIEVQKQSAQWQKDSGQFIPMPSTWLNQRRWEDDYGSVNGKPADDGGIYDPVTGLTTMPNGCRVLRL